MTYVEDRLKRIQRKYGLTPEQWRKLFDSTNGRCPMCLHRFSSTRLPCVDECHKTGLVRGLACTACNVELGYHHDNAGWFTRAAKYLEHPPAVDIIGRVYVPGSVGEHLAG